MKEHLRRLLRPRAMLLEALVALTLFSVTTGERAFLAAQREIMEAGDAFNFLSLAQAYSQGRLVKGEKRLPLYPLAILAGWKGLGLDPLVAATAVSVLAGGGTTALLYLLGRRLGIHLLPLALFLLLLTLDPVTNSMGIRPLSDSLFLFLVVLGVYRVTVVGPTRRAALLTGGLFGLLMLTRFEGLVLAPILTVLLLLRLSWRRVLLAALPVLLLYIAWVPYSEYVHGSIGGGYFTEWSDKEGAVGGKLVDVPEKLQRIASGIGWTRPWTYASWVIREQPGNPFANILSSASWWIGVLAILGVFWLLVAAGRRALPFLAVFLVFSVMYSLWVVYGRFVAPGIPAFYVAAAGGASALFSLLRRLWRPPILRLAFSGALTVFLLWIVRAESPELMKGTARRVFRNEGSGYSLVLAIRELAGREGRVAFHHDLMAILYLGIIGDPLAPPGRAVMLGEAPEAERGKTIEDKTVEQAEQLRALNVRYLVERGEPRMLRLLALLEKRGAVVGTEEIRFPLGHPPHSDDFDATRIHTLIWK